MRVGKEEESVYALDGSAPSAPKQGGPRVAKYMVQAPGQKVKMHVDSSQVGKPILEEDFLSHTRLSCCAACQQHHIIKCQHVNACALMALASPPTFGFGPTAWDSP